MFEAPNINIGWLGTLLFQSKDSINKTVVTNGALQNFCFKYLLCVRDQNNID